MSPFRSVRRAAQVEYAFDTDSRTRHLERRRAERTRQTERQANRRAADFLKGRR